MTSFQGWPAYRVQRSVGGLRAWRLWVCHPRRYGDGEPAVGKHQAAPPVLSISAENGREKFQEASVGPFDGSRLW